MADTIFNECPADLTVLSDTVNLTDHQETANLHQLHPAGSIREENTFDLAQN